MSDRTIGDGAAVVMAVLAALLALLAPPVPWQLALGLVGVAVFVRRPPLLAVALALLVGGRAHQQLDALSAPLPERLDGVGVLAGDPTDEQYGVRFIVDLDGRRYVAEVDREIAAPLRGAGTGDHLWLSGRPSPLRGAPEGWVRSRHLAGRLSVRSLQRGPPAAPWYAAANSVRRTLTAGAASFDDDRRPLYLGMVIGDDRQLSELRQHRFRTAGLNHLTAVSGQNVAFLIAVAAPALSRVGRRSRAVLTLVLLVAMVLVTRADPSVLRAGVMAGLAVLAVSTGRIAPAVRILTLTITILLLADPMLVHALGFRLSIAATAGLVVLAGPIESHLPGPAWLRLPLAVTLAAQLATAPLVVGLNGGISPASVPANLLGVPAAGAVMMLGVTVGTLAGLVAEPVAAVLQLPARVLVGWIDLVAGVAAGAPCGLLDRVRLVAVVGAIVGAGLARPRCSPRGRRALVAAAVLVVVALCWPRAPGPGEHPLSDDVTVVVGSCGGVVARLSGSVDESDALAALQQSSLRRIDLLVVEPGRAARAAAASVGEQWPVRRRLDAGPALGGSWTVGGVEVVADGSSVTIGLSRAACRLTP